MIVVLYTQLLYISLAEQGHLRYSSSLGQLDDL